VTSAENSVELARRAWVERLERFRDAEEDYTAKIGQTIDKEERRQLMQEFAEYRMAHRMEDVNMGKRPAGTAVMMRQVMWARWIEIAVASELQAREEFGRITSEPESGALVSELRASLVAISACAHTIEALYGEIKYLLPAPTRRGGSRDRRLTDGICLAFGISDGSALRSRLAWLGGLRDFAVHPYTESEVTQPHPAGIHTGVEASRFNAVECGKAVDLTMEVLGTAWTPPSPYGRWVARWVREREPYHATVVEPLRVMRDGATQVP